MTAPGLHEYFGVTTQPINSRRVGKFLAEFNRFGQQGPGGGISRVAYSKEDMAAKTLLVKKLKGLGMHVYRDAVGNIAGLTHALSAKRSFTLVGSHLDTVQNGGGYDGTLGVVAALELLYQRREGALAPDLPLGLLCFACEEATRFAAPTIGSRFLMGDIGRRDFCRLLETSGVSSKAASATSALADVGAPRPKSLEQVLAGREVQAAMRRWGTALESGNASGLNLRRLKTAAFFELHIDQGAALQRFRVPVGLVTRIAAPTRLRICLQGERAHSGATTMKCRTDLFLFAGGLWRRFCDFCLAQGEEGLVWTLIGVDTPLRQWGTIPGELRMDIEIRSTRVAAKQRCLRHLRRLLQEEQRGCAVRVAAFDILHQGNPTRMDAELLKVMARTAEKLGIRTARVLSMAGHDAATMAQGCRSALIFVPCTSGVSHSPKESVSLADVVPGMHLLLESVKATCGSVSS